MRTPKKFNELLKKRIITDEMLGLCCYSANKRAKNCRDKQKEYRHRRISAWEFGWYYSDRYNSERQYAEKKEYYYELKEKMLAVVKPECIHFEVDYGDENKKKYYLLYRVGNYTFHQPLLEAEVEKYSDLEQIKLENFFTFGKEITELISVPFVKKVVELIESGNYIYLVEEANGDKGIAKEGSI